MARLTDEKINEIRQSVDIVDVIGSYLPLVKKGRNYTAVCPFHNDTNPSMSISTDKQIYKCFVCNNGGNVFTFIKNYLKVSYIEAVKKVAEIGNVDMSEYQMQVVKKPVDKRLEPLYKMHEEATKIYSYYLQTKSGIPAKEYLTDRDIQEEVIETFQIGYAMPNQVLVKAFTNMGYSLLEMVASGLVIESRDGFDRFSDRIMFPLYDQEGRVVGFSGRVFKKGSTDAKYMNSPESDIFIKGETLYNYHRVKESVRKEGYVILCEGFMDVIAFHRAGIENAIAIMGTALTIGHVKALRKLTQHIYLCLDGDTAGKQATLKSIEILENQKFEVRVATLPKDSDPDEVLQKNGKEELQAIIKNVVSSLQFKMTYYEEQYNMQNYEDRKAFLEKMIPSITRIQDVIDKDYYITELEKKSGFSKQIILSTLQQNETPEPILQEAPRYTYTRSKQLINKYVQAERNLLHYMMEDKEVSNQYEKKLGFMFDSVNHIIASYIVDYYRQNIVLEVADLVSSIEDEQIIQNIIDISEIVLPPIRIQEDGNTIYQYQVVEDYINVIKEKTTKKREEEVLKEELKHTQDPIQKADILKKIIALKERN